MERIIEVLMIDDDKDNFDSLKNRAAEKNILLKYTSNLEDMLVELESNLQIDAVILDGKGFRRRDQVRGSEKSDFVHEALTELKMLERKQDRFIPKCVYTAWFDQLKDSLESRIRIFDKKKLAQENKLMDDLFEFLHTEVASTSNKKMKIKYAEVFSGIGGKYLPDNKEESIIRIISRIEENKEIQQSDFNELREVLEAIYKRANKIDEAFIPNDLIVTGERPNLTWCYRYLVGLEVEVKDGPKITNVHPQKGSIVPKHIGESIKYLKEISSILSHAYGNKWTSLSFKSAALALMEVIIWFKSYIDTKYPNI